MHNAASTLERAVDIAVRYSPAQPLFRWRSGRHLAVLAYHDVRDAGLFAAHMRALLRMARPISADEVCSALSTNRGLPPRAVLVTFDDGDRSILDVALPVLERYGVPAVAFVVAGALDTDSPLWWQEAEALLTAESDATRRRDPAAAIRQLKRVPNEQRVATMVRWRNESHLVLPRKPQLRRWELATLERANVEIGNHSFSHPCLDQCDDNTLEYELTEAHRVLSDALDRAPRLFAYPNGNFDYRALTVLRRLDYKGAFLFDHRIGRFPPRERFAISRLRVNSTTSVHRFRTIVSGLHSAIHRARGLA
jgi:peptidoglycan/xylan/chitin deacetylase (PgdA/CDA1 family)